MQVDHALKIIPHEVPLLCSPVFLVFCLATAFLSQAGSDASKNPQFCYEFCWNHFLLPRTTLHNTSHLNLWGMELVVERIICQKLCSMLTIPTSN